MRNRVRIGCGIFLLLAASDSIAAGTQAPLKLEPCTRVQKSTAAAMRQVATARARRSWPNSQVIRIPDLGHFPSGLDHVECMDQIIAPFFEAGTAKGLDASCLRSMHAPAFYTGDDAPPKSGSP